MDLFTTAIFLLVGGGMCMLAVIGIPVIFWLGTTWYTNATAMKKAGQTAAAYLEAIRTENYPLAATYIAKIVLADTAERDAWVEKMEQRRGRVQLVEYQIGAPFYRAVSGNYTGLAEVSVSAKVLVAGKQLEYPYTMKLMSDRNDAEDLKQWVSYSPEIEDEVRERVVDHVLLLTPVRKRVAPA